uniref:Uncharacterized protein n=1 Tax=Spongospora subterranea TaxID=70186 RepID=A0A0H5QV79_9EUKA|eukprot:CRZ05501.1 hypothetical protein [Spongospora subterranea]
MGSISQYKTMSQIFQSLMLRLFQMIGAICSSVLSLKLTLLCCLRGAVIEIIIDREFNVAVRGVNDCNDANCFGKPILINKSQCGSFSEHGTGVAARDEEMNRALLCASESECDVKIGVLLLKYGADINNAEGEYGHTALMKASSKGRIDWVAMLLENGADITAADFYENTALSFAAANIHKNDMKVFLFLLKCGANIHTADITGYTTLMGASQASSVRWVEMLLKNGAYVTDREEEFNTALLCATNNSNCDLKIGRLLLDYGSDVNAADHLGDTALMRVSTHGRVDWVKMLLKHGAEVAARDRYGGTALLYAIIKKRDVNIGRLLLQYGADVNATDGEGRTALSVASACGRYQFQCCVNFQRKFPLKTCVYYFALNQCLICRPVSTLLCINLFENSQSTPGDWQLLYSSA